MLDEGTDVAQEAENNQDHELPPPVVTRTRSGRRVRAPAALLDSQVGKTPTRQTRKSVLQELPSENSETAVKCVPESEPAPCIESQETEVFVQPTGGDMPNSDTDMHHFNPTTIDTAPKRPDKTAKKRTHSESSGKHNTTIPLGKPKSGRVWKDRNKQR